MSKEDISFGNIIYNINEEDKKFENINIFGSEFVKYNKNICKMIIDNEEYEITEIYNVKNYKNKKLQIKLKGIDNVTDMSYMFSECSLLSSLSDLLNWNTNKVSNMSNMFSGCSTLLSLPDISKWKINNIRDMSTMFYGCSSLSSLSNISKWNTIPLQI